MYHTREMSSYIEDIIQLSLMTHFHTLGNTAAFTYYYDPVILRNKLTPLSIFRDLGLRKRDSKKCMLYFYVLYRVYTNIQK